jgi:Tfp pilus assembly protein PilN
VCAIVILPILGIYTIKINSRLYTLRDRNKVIEAYIQENNHILSANENIKRLESLIEKGMGKTPDWAQYIIILGESKPNGVIIDSIKTDPEDTETVLVIDGRAQSQRAVTDYVEWLGKSDALRSIKCNFVKQTEPQGGYSSEFQFIAYIGEVEQFKLDRGGSYEESTN